MGNKMVDYLEKQIILDYHFRGEQDIFEQEFPSLKTKAESFIGYETYFGLSPLTGSPLSEEEHPEHLKGERTEKRLLLGDRCHKTAGSIETMKKMLLI